MMMNMYKLCRCTELKAEAIARRDKRRVTDTRLIITAIGVVVVMIADCLILRANNRRRWLD